MAEPILSVRDLEVTFPTDDGPVTAVREMSFDVSPGETLAVVGESGSGKTVTAMSIMGLHPKGTKVSGSINLLGDELVGMPVKQLRKLRGKDVAMIFQDPMTAMNPVFTVGSQISEAIRIHDSSVNKEQGLKRAAELLDAVGVPEPDRRARQYPHEYSGGMRQRAMIAMAIANQPKLLIADEPTTALDVTIQAQIVDLMTDLIDRLGMSLIWITHDLGVVAGIADTIQVMYGGMIMERGPTRSVFKDTRNAYTLGLLSSLPRSDGGTERLVPIPGAPPNLLAPPVGDPFAPRNPYATEKCFQERPVLQPVEGGHPEHLAAAWYDLQAVANV